ncbi:MAG: hypothetical protein QNJ84_07010 [Alphaproteobacteria bacterium]|nr:hypothetical protein [Alphaproteobacteria bacterium]
MTVFSHIGRTIRPLALVLILASLSGCYLPDRFRLDMNFQRDGDYAFTYDGDLKAVNFFRKIGQGEVSADDKKEIQVYINDLRRDSGFSAVEYLGQARYRVSYRRQSNILKRPQFSFVRRNAPFLRIMRNAEGLVVVEGNRPKKAHRDQLNQAGFDVDGVVQLWTDAQVLDHNAQEVQPGSPTLYRWVIRSINDPMPRMVMNLRRAGS